MDPMHITRGARARLIGGAGLALALVAVGLAPAAVAAPDPLVDALLVKRLDNPRLGTNVGLLAIDAATGEVVSDHGSTRPMRPASNMKIVTAVTALAALGPEARFTTRVRAFRPARPALPGLARAFCSMVNVYTSELP